MWHLAGDTVRSATKSKRSEGPQARDPEVKEILAELAIKLRRSTTDIIHIHTSPKDALFKNNLYIN